MQPHLDLVLAERLDGVVEEHLALVDVDALRLQELRDVARGDRAVEHLVLAHLAGRHFSTGIEAGMAQPTAATAIRAVFI